MKSYFELVKYIKFNNGLTGVYKSACEKLLNVEKVDEGFNKIINIMQKI